MLGKIFAGQSALRITVVTFCDLEGIEGAVIRYRKPDGTTGEFTAAAWGTWLRGLFFMSVLRGR